jgi:hypothetical protein
MLDFVYHPMRERAEERGRGKARSERMGNMVGGWRWAERERKEGKRDGGWVVSGDG